MKPRLLDLFCGAGGAAVGYHRAGFEVVGVDNRAQPNYPFEFIEGDALLCLERMVAGGTFEWLGRGLFAAVHASPPCQAYSSLGAMHPTKKAQYPALLAEVRTAFRAWEAETDVLWVIENVEGAPMASHPQLDGTWGLTLCGSQFGLGVERGHLRRHRLFESNVPISEPPCNHVGPAVGVYGHGGHSGKHRMLYRAEASEAMGIDWMTRDEMTQAIPPVYTEHIGGYLMAEVQARKVAA